MDVTLDYGARDEHHKHAVVLKHIDRRGWRAGMAYESNSGPTRPWLLAMVRRRATGLEHTPQPSIAPVSALVHSAGGGWFASPLISVLPST